MAGHHATTPAGPLFDYGGHPHDRAYFARYRRSLRRRLLVAYLAPLLVLSLFFHYQYITTMEEGVYNHLQAVAENQRNTVDLFLQERVSNLRNNFQHDTPDIPPPPGAIEIVLRNLRQASPTFVDAGLFGPDGTLVSYAGPHAFLRGKNYAGERWFRQLVDHEKSFTISDVYLGFRGKPHFIIAVRREVDGRPWILRASVDPEKFGEFVRSSHLVEEAESFIVNDRGERQTLSEHETGGTLEGVDLSPSPASPAHVAVSTAGGIEALNAVSWLNEHTWAVVVRVPSAQAFAPLRQARLFLVILMLIALVLIVVLVDGSTRRLVGRLEASDSDVELLRRQLFNAAKLASVGEMAAGVAHEINNPLAIIHEEASLLKDLSDPQFGQRVDAAELRERLDAIIAATLRGRTITRNLLAFSREHDAAVDWVDLHAVVEQVLVTKALEFRVSNIELQTAFAPSLPKVQVNRNQIEQVLYNLLNNARDAIGRDGRIAIRTRVDEREIQLDIEDTGCGMSEEQTEKVFFPFYTTKQVGKGTGLGLSISYGIMRSFGGRIEVKSQVGKGSTFTLVLPVRAREPRDPGPA